MSQHPPAIPQPLLTNPAQNARDISRALLNWAHDHAIISNIPHTRSQQQTSLDEVFPSMSPELRLRFHEKISKSKIIGIIKSANNNKITIVTRGSLYGTKKKPLPASYCGVIIEYIEHGDITIDQFAVQQSTENPSPCFLYNNCITCGSSVTAAPIPSAGTLGFLAKDQTGQLFGVTNNHVTGGCNHTQPGMHILMPSPVDAAPDGPPPLAIGRHAQLVRLVSGYPQQNMPAQKIDVATFKIEAPERISSMQGFFYDTPHQLDAIQPGMTIQKVGRTTGLTRGIVVGQYDNPVPIKYTSPNFSGHVYFSDFYVVRGLEAAFSLPGDSGSLVVNEDGSAAVGLVFAGAEANLSYVIPIEDIVSAIGLEIVSGHNVSPHGGHDERQDQNIDQGT